jgi:hypothetical protein
VQCEWSLYHYQHSHKHHKYIHHIILVQSDHTTTPCLNYTTRYGDLTEHQQEYNNLFGHARACVEHVNSFCIYSHALFHGRPFIGTFENLHAYTAITIHTTALFIRQAPSHQLPGFGWWAHYSPFA